MTKVDLHLLTGLSAATIPKMGCDHDITTELLVRICDELGCRLEQVAVAVPQGLITGDDHA